MVTDAKKEANRRWDAKNMTILGCRIRKDKADEFKAVCAATGTSPNAVFMAVVDQMLADYKKEKGPDA